MKRKFLIGLILILSIALVGCSSSQFNIVGVWSDATGATRIFDKDGTCKNVSVLDVAHSVPYSLSNSPDKNGYYSLKVSESSFVVSEYNVKVINNDKIEIYVNDDKVPIYSEVPLYRLTRK